MQQSRLQVCCIEQFFVAITEQGDGVVGHIADIPLRVDGQPRFPFRTQHVAVVQVAVNKCVRLLRTQLPEGQESGFDLAPVQGVG
ncbi:hypothetical protein SPAR_41884 [Streptomyces sparsogenes DSM 40356]|uniref:Uncharacterized protein n=1 Tax=Streptomyces sparsogenes DSM 40356 TaxID=1331668 RepID=A0A1R1S4V6_9ACTN|nr:hypothetical protein SPAR_41884 [Streptomyces sparsogenes DSM 40356]